MVPGSTWATTPIIEGVETYKIGKDLLHQTAKWKKMPAVVVCTHAPIEKEAVKKAVKFWKDLGYRFHSAIYFKDLRAAEACTAPEPTGYILIDLVTQETFGTYDDMAITHFYVDNFTREIYWARIYLKNNVEERVLEHELGHALGWLHTKSRGHLMHKKWFYGGWDTTGLKKQ